MTISEIKRLTAQTSPYFFTRDTMKFFGQTMKDFKVSKQPDGRYYVSALMRNNGKVVGKTERFFNPVTNELELK